MILGDAADFPDVGDRPQGPWNEQQGALADHSVGGTAGGFGDPADPDYELWPEGIVPYNKFPSVEDEENLNEAIARWNENTPITLVERTDEDNWVTFKFDGGCGSLVGMRPDGDSQPISIGRNPHSGPSDPCSVGNIVHEIGHTLGFLHEQMRWDRDVYVDIVLENVEDGEEDNFRRQEYGNDVGRYDYGSIMHYGPYAFAKANGADVDEETLAEDEKTIVAPEPIGQRKALSDGDLETISAVYNPVDRHAIVADDEWRTVPLDGMVARDPVLVSSLQTEREADTADVRLRGAGSGGIDVRVAEETGGDAETDHATEAIGSLATIPGSIVDETATRIGETGTVSIAEAGYAPDWHRVDLDGSYADPVVFAQVQTANDAEPVHTRVRGVGPDEFVVRLEEWRQSDYGNHAEETIGYVVLEAGTHTLRAGVTLTVGTVDADENWADVTYEDTKGDPVVITRCQTVNDETPVATRARRVSDYGFDVRLQTGEATSGHAVETVGHVTIDQTAELEAGRTPTEPSEDTHATIDYNAVYARPPVTVASVADDDGSPTVTPRVTSRNAGEATVRLEESPYFGSSHGRDAVSYVATPDGPVLDANADEVGEAGTANRVQDVPDGWHGVDLDRAWGEDPVVFAQVASENETTPVHARVREVSSGGYRTPANFEYRLEEWSADDGTHVAEDVDWLALHDGVHELPDGTLMEVGRTEAGATGTTVSLDDRLGAGDPYDASVVARTQTDNNAVPVVTGLSNVSPSGFDVAVEHDDADAVAETVGYLAVVHDA